MRRFIYDIIESADGAKRRIPSLIYDFDKDTCIFGLFELVKIPGIYKFKHIDNKNHKETVYEIESVYEDDLEEPVIRFGDTWYHDIEEFFTKAKIGNEFISTLYNDLELVNGEDNE